MRRIVVLTLVFMLVLVGCGHEHNFEGRERDRGCKDNKIMEYRCKECGAEKEEEMNIKGNHKYGGKNNCMFCGAENPTKKYKYKSNNWAYSPSQSIQRRGMVDFVANEDGTFELTYSGTDIFGIARDDVSFKAKLSLAKEEDNKKYLHIEEIQWTSYGYDNHVYDFYWVVTDDYEKLSWAAWDFVKQELD